MHSIKSPRLDIGYELPGEGYRRTRFDWSSAIVSIDLDQRHRFSSSEYTEGDANYLAGGRALACEFGIHAPVAYDAVAVGDWFPKVGVGFLRRESGAPYDFFHRYREMRVQVYKAEATEDVLRVESYAEPYGGYGWRLTRIWKVEDAKLECAATLENLGERPIETDEYCHNFLKLGTASVGSDYRIDFSFPIPAAASEVSDPSSCLRGAIPEIVREPKTDFYLGGLMPSPTDNPSWRLRDVRTGLSVTERLSGTGIRCALWGRSHVISPEMFIRISVAPGLSQEWKRTWEFGC